MLYDAARRVPRDEWIVEIGSHHGRSTTILAAGRPDGVGLLAVDPYDDERWGGGPDSLDIFRRNTEGLGVELERGYGAEVGRRWDQPVGMLFIDGAHDYPTVLADFESWRPHLTNGATVLFHDAFSSPGVTRALWQAMFWSSDFAYACSSRSLVAFRRQSGTTVTSAVRMIAKVPWFVRNLALKLLIRRGWIDRQHPY